MPEPARLRLPNADARRLFLARHALSDAGPETPGKPGLVELIRRLGFVQVDSISTVERAHHMILSARRKSYRPAHLTPLLERDRLLFEHWTHDASLIPTEFFPHWRPRFARDRARLLAAYRDWQGEFAHRFDDVLAHIERHGPAQARDLAGEDEARTGAMWSWTPSKTALEYLWRTGELAVCSRSGFQKSFDLARRVIPAEHHDAHPTREETIDWACRGALDRLGFATSGEIAAFWDTVTPEEAKGWCAARLAEGAIEEVEIEGDPAATGGAIRRAFAWPGLDEAAAAAPPAPGRLRVLSPFDPALRDRGRAQRLFGFFYRIEIYVPAPKRRWGYYVFPLLEGDRLVGRIDMKRREGRLEVSALWPEVGVAFGKGRLARLEAELARVARFAGCEGTAFLDGWLREGAPPAVPGADAPETVAD